MKQIDISHYQSIDKSNMLQSILDWPDIIAAVWADMKHFVLPSNYSRIDNVLILGMGTNRAIAQCLKSAAFEHSNIPVEIVSDYIAPKYITNTTLVIALSYSGNTEEIVASFLSAAKNNGKIIAISSEGELSSICRKYHAPYYTINYGAESRAAMGYGFIAILSIMAKLGLVEINDKSMQNLVKMLKNLIKKINPSNPRHLNYALQIAEKIYDKIPYLIGSPILEGVISRAKQQFNENAKTISFCDLIPESLHNSIKMFRFPAKLEERFFVLFLVSFKDHSRNQQRFNIYQQLLDKNNISHETISVGASSDITTEILCLIVLFDFISYYLAILNNTDPSENEINKFISEKLLIKK
ncbi:MAG: glucose/mannose-6-phosphate isomerase [Candidatus Berkelbacteria bacterium Licking1014_85]|uniref:Glutamine--fructose-6-phosphate aminotransferase [isomerizing] n=1 Tax=Candidatus Berkelbacteria bacterium Licking1014_85 TaxID=2017148 RepID=A0A554LKQ4_9BACT|nr:MAG: glucose/mannose-6-phosphate isomerase [Candidatus Berkelbacteria bacterium Licking1014_85]